MDNYEKILQTAVDQAKISKPNFIILPLNHVTERFASAFGIINLDIWSNTKVRDTVNQYITEQGLTLGVQRSALSMGCCGIYICKKGV